jgi:hypothetical protein
VRALVGLLLLANLLFFAWSQGWLDEVAGVRATGDREPERMARQVRPESLRVLTPQAVAAAASAAEARLVCLQAGPFDAGGIAAAEAAVASTLPSGTWARQSIEQPPRWILYLGRYTSRDALQRKEQELARVRVPFEPISNAPELQPGLVLGRYTERDAADAALARLTQRGVQGGRVLQLAQPATLHLLRVERADAELAQKVTALRLDALGRGFVPCARP